MLVRTTFSVLFDNEEIEYFNLFNQSSLAKRPFFEWLYPQLEKVLRGRTLSQSCQLKRHEAACRNIVLRFDLNIPKEKTLYLERKAGRFTPEIKEFIKRKMIEWVRQEFSVILGEPSPQSPLPSPMLNQGEPVPKAARKKVIKKKRSTPSLSPHEELNRSMEGYDLTPVVKERLLSMMDDMEAVINGDLPPAQTLERYEKGKAARLVLFYMDKLSPLKERVDQVKALIEEDASDRSEHNRQPSLGVKKGGEEESAMSTGVLGEIFNFGGGAHG